MSLHPEHVRQPQAVGLGALLFIAGLSLGLLAASITDRLVARFGDRDIDLIHAVREIAVEDFVGDADPHEVADDALRGMLTGLDRYSHFYGRNELAQLDRDTSGEFRGIGVVFRQPTELGQILFPFPGSPAERAGIRVGDRLVEIAGRAVADLGPGGLQRVIREERGATIAVKVLGLDGQEREAAIALETLLDPTVRHARMVDPARGIGYLAITSFSHRTPEEFDRAMADLARHGLRRLVIDLRSNPGGILDAAVLIANRFLVQGTIVQTRTRRGTEVREAQPAEARHADLPLVLLVDGGSASASEVLAGALQDHSAAVLVGEPTYGKGTVQTLRRLLDDRGVVKITTAVYHTPSNRSIERWEAGEGGAGITPDLLVEIGTETRAGIQGFLGTYSPPEAALEALRAWEAREGSSLVPPAPRDPQLVAALELFPSEPDASAPERAR
jgi:carboxyl-terminal processing protease